MYISYNVPSWTQTHIHKGSKKQRHNHMECQFKHLFNLSYWLICGPHLFLLPQSQASSLTRSTTLGLQILPNISITAGNIYMGSVSFENFVSSNFTEHSSSVHRFLTSNHEKPGQAQQKPSQSQSKRFTSHLVVALCWHFILLCSFYSPVLKISSNSRNSQTLNNFSLGFCARSTKQ